MDVERLFTIYGPSVSTALISWGNLPPTPKRVRALQAQFGMPLQYLALFNLIWQCGGRQDWKLSATVTAIFLVLNKFLSA